MESFKATNGKKAGTKFETRPIICISLRMREKKVKWVVVVGWRV